MKKFLENLFSKKDQVKIGDIVKCIDDRNWGNAETSINLVFGQKYKVLNILKCPHCGCDVYDIGGRFIENELFTHCSETHSLPGRGIHWAASRRFAKSTLSNEEIEEQIEEAVSKELYEKASELKKLLV